MRRFNNIRDIRRYLANLINRVDQDNVDPGKAGKIGYLCSILHRVLLDGEIETRLTALEIKLNIHGGKIEK